MGEAGARGRNFAAGGASEQWPVPFVQDDLPDA
jgi:hypothetical protein